MVTVNLLFGSDADTEEVKIVSGSIDSGLGYEMQYTELLAFRQAAPRTLKKGCDGALILQ